MPRADWRQALTVMQRSMSAGSSMPRLPADRSLTALFVFGGPTARKGSISPADWGLIGSPKPSAVAEELGGRRPVTAIAEHDITRFTCEVEGGRARGLVEFEAEGLWRGRVEYAAEKRGLEWTITEFRLPASRMGVRLEGTGRWRFFSEGASE